MRTAGESGMGHTCDEAVIGGLDDGPKKLDDVSVTEGAQNIGLQRGKQKGMEERIF